MDVDSVRVALRIRPLVPSEIDRGCQEVVEHIAGLNQVIVNRSDAFTFNHIFDTKHTQHDVYTNSVAVLVDKYFDGFNSTILAYGQTGSGKTHTMGTAFNGRLDDDVGVIPRVMYEIFNRIEQQRQQCEYAVSCSFMELYQEQLYDLLSSKPRDEAVVDIREDRNGIIIPGLSEVAVASAKATTDCLERGSSGRAVAATAMNQQSSRSHAIFTVTMQATTRGEKKTVTTSKFHLVDLAGSERSKKTQATGDRFKEGVKINQGLLALGNVISALGSGQVGSFVRYRDSKLTRLLQDSLGGNSVTLMIACVSPADYNVPETLSTLRYADRARKIKNKPIVNQDPHAAEINHLKDVIQKLRMELLAAGGSDANVSSLMRSKSVCDVSARHSNGQSALYKQLLEKHEKLEGKYHNVQRQLQSTLHELAENELCAHINEVAHENLKAKTNEMKVIIGELKQEFTVDASPEKIAANVQRVEKIYQLAAGLDEELERTQHEIDDHKRQEYKLNADNNHDDNNSAEQSREVNAMMQEQADEYTNKQMNFKEQLNRLNRELNIKEELHQRVAGNLDKFYTLDHNIEDKFKECETKIHELESEKTELMEKLKHMKGNATAKLAEERRKRLHALEQEITDMKRKNMQQAKLLKVREKETQKIKNLHSEIQVMKESKVKLIRTMRQEAENFRQWKFQREKELIQLKNKDRKLQNEMARKEALHTKQRNVLKRKCEEAMAINKRLKDALDRQRVAQTQRQKAQAAQSTKGAASVAKIEQVIADVDRELEVILSLIDAEHSLEQLMEDRSLIKRQIAALKETPADDDAADQAAAAAQGSELANLEEELQMRNAQIADLQQKVCTTDMDTCMRNLLDSIGSVVEARAMVKQLLTTIGDMRRENASRSLELKTALDEQRGRCDAAEEQCRAAAKRMRMLELDHEEAIAERENTYEEKIAVLLRELHSAPQLAAGTIITPEQEERLRIQEEQLNKMDKLREELEYYRGLANQMTVMLSDEDDELDKDDDLRDPDWKATPMVNRSRSKTSYDNNTVISATGTATTDNSTADESFVTAQTRASKRRAQRCVCRGNCSSKRCGCMANKLKCSGDCRCGDDCTNGKTHDDHDDNSNADCSDLSPVNGNCTDENDSNCVSSTVMSNGNSIGNNNNSVTTPPTEKTFDFVKPAFKPDVSAAAVHLTPKMARMSYISFDTPSAKKKFFD